MKKIIVLVLLVCSLIVFGCSQNSNDSVTTSNDMANSNPDNSNVNTHSPNIQGEKIIMGILPLRNPTDMLDRFGPTEAYLKDKTGLDITLKFYPTEGELGGYTQVVKEITSGEIGLAYLAPVTIVQAHGVNKNVIPFICAQNSGSPTYQGDLVVLASSEYENLEDLEGKKVTGTSKSSTSGNLFPSALLMDKGIDKETYFDGGMQYLGSHDKAVEAVLAGTMDAAFINEATFNKYNSEGQLRSIWKHDSVAEFPFVVNTDVINEETLAIINDALLVMHETNLEGIQAVNSNYDKWVSISWDDYAAAKKACDSVHGDILYDLDNWR
ncbi:phosphate/phosphite/phosphonate ABC transporter substrate-binding protein [Candidatus Woesearchaeota archaeon]|nr:phosphate/phosphite/phosphonate ABC transporter substrate-binding protein [Candidatus Woesearchaeota archaeon]